MRTVILTCLLVAASGVAPAAGGRFAALSELRVDEPVEGDVLALGADVVLGPRALVHGDVITLLGEIEMEPGARVDGHLIAVTSLAEVRLAPVGVPEEPRLELAVRLLTVGGWLLLSSLAAFLLGSRVRFGIWLVAETGMKTAVLGMLVAITLVAALVAVMAAGPTVGVPLAATLAVLFLAVKALGLSVLGGALGGRVLGALRGRPSPLTVEVFLGVAALLMVRFLPVVGEALWTVVVVVALGAAVFTLALVPELITVRASRS